MERIIIAGAGLVGSLLAVFLSRRGYRVDVYDRNPDPRASAPALEETQRKRIRPGRFK